MSARSRTPRRVVGHPLAGRLAGAALALVAAWATVAARPLHAQDAAPQAAPAVVVLPVQLPFALFKPALEAAFPVETDREEVWTEGRPLPDGSKARFQVYFFRGPAAFAVEGGDLVVRFDEVQYRLRTEITRPSGRIVSGSCGYGEQWPRRARLVARSGLAWGEGWRLVTKTSFAPPELRDPCRLADGTDLGPLLEQGLTARLAAAAAALDRALADQGSGKERFRTLWRALERPYELVPGTWLEMGPSAAAAGPFEGDARALRTSIALTLAPVVTVAATIPARTTEPPPLRVDALPPAGMKLRMPVRASFAEVARRLESDLVGTELSVVPGRTVRIVSVAVGGSGAAFAVDLGLAGALDGVAHVVGRPLLSADGATVQFTDLQATVETRGRLAQALSGVTEKALVYAVEKYAVIDLRARLEAVRQGLLNALNREIAPGLWLQGGTAPPRVESFAPTGDGVEVRLLIEAEPRIEVR